VIERIAGKGEVRSAVAEARREGRTIALVPTMGALHEGHLSLVRAARMRADFVVVSVFVNPTQFGPGEDFDRYPRRIDADLELLGDEGVDIVFVPSAESMYQDGTDIVVDPGELAQRWEGALRPGHFSGVTTVVAKLFNLVSPDLAFFGEKDYQQLRVIGRMARQLDFGVGVVGCPTVRDADGLALSSRNVHLSASERAAALPSSRRR
jgi:pantoate--beta-alanine ligase